MRRKRGVVRQSLICSIKPLGYLSSGLPIYPIMGAEGDDDGGEDEGGDEEEDEEDDDGDDKSKDKKSKDEEKLPKPKRRAPANETDAQKIKRLNAENKERREAAAALEVQLRERNDKEKTELEVAQRDSKEFKAKYDKASEELLAAKVENAFLKFTDGKTKYEWQDPDLVLDILNSKYELEIGEDGTVEGLAAAIKELAKNKPFLLANAEDDDEKRDNRVRKTQGPSGGAAGSRKSSGGKQQAERDKLTADYPVLNQGVAIR